MGIEQLTHEFGVDPHLFQPGFRELLEFIDTELGKNRWFDTIYLEQFIERGKYKRIGVVKIGNVSSIGSEDVTPEEICKYIFEVFSRHLKSVELVRFSFVGREVGLKKSKHVRLKGEAEYNEYIEQFVMLSREQRTYIIELHEQLRALMESGK